MALAAQRGLESGDPGEQVRSATRQKLGKDPAYLAWLHTLPCVCCESLRLFLIEAGNLPENIPAQSNPTEAAHVGDRGKSQKCPDRQAIPLCGHDPRTQSRANDHHREGPTSAHKLGKGFWRFWGINREELIATLNSKYGMETGNTLLDAREVCV